HDRGSGEGPGGRHENGAACSARGYTERLEGRRSLTGYASRCIAGLVVAVVTMAAVVVRIAVLRGVRGRLIGNVSPTTPLLPILPWNLLRARRLLRRGLHDRLAVTVRSRPLIPVRLEPLAILLRGVEVRRVAIGVWLVRSWIRTHPT